MKCVDLSLPLENDGAWSPWWARNRVTYQGHKFGAFVIRFLFGAKKQHLKTGLGWANENIALSTHGTTHMDAPWHYGPECEGRPAKTIDQIPLEWCHGRGVVLDIRDVDTKSSATLDDVQSAMTSIGHTLAPGEIVLIRTDNDQKWGQRDYFSSGPGVNVEATPGSSFRGSRSWASMPGAGMLHWPYRQRTHELRIVPTSSGPPTTLASRRNTATWSVSPTWISYRQPDLPFVRSR